jgi:hypothetical protein
MDRAHGHVDRMHRDDPQPIVDHWRRQSEGSPELTPGGVFLAPKLTARRRRGRGDQGEPHRGQEMMEQRWSDASVELEGWRWSEAHR